MIKTGILIYGLMNVIVTIWDYIFSALAAVFASTYSQLSILFKFVGDCLLTNKLGIPHIVRSIRKEGASYRAIAARCNISKSTVARYITDPHYASIIVPKCGRKALLADVPDDLLIERYKAFGCKANLLWKDITQHPAEYGLPLGFDVSQRTIVRHVNRIYKGERKAFAVRDINDFHVKSGQQLQIDFITFPFTFANGETRKVHVFEAVYAHSRLLRAHVCKNMKQSSWLSSLSKVLLEYGIPSEILCDNDKSLVTFNDGEGHVRFNPTFAWLLKTLGTEGKACRPYSPKTKGRVERAGGYIKSNFVQYLKGRRTPIKDEAELQQKLEQWCIEEADERVFDGQKVKDRYQAERSDLLFSKYTIESLAFQGDSFRASKNGHITVHGQKIKIRDEDFWGEMVHVSIVSSGKIFISNGLGLTIQEEQIPKDNLVNYPFKVDEKSTKATKKKPKAASTKVAQKASSVKVDFKDDFEADKGTSAIKREPSLDDDLDFLDSL